MNSMLGLLNDDSVSIFRSTTMHFDNFSPEFFDTFESHKLSQATDGNACVLQVNWEGTLQRAGKPKEMAYNVHVRLAKLRAIERQIVRQVLQQQFSKFVAAGLINTMKQF